MPIVEDLFGEPEPAEDAWAHATGWDERDFAPQEEVESRSPGVETVSGPAPTPVLPERPSASPHPLHVVSGVGGVAVVLVMLVKLFLIGSLVNGILSSAHAGAWTYVCTYGVVGVFVGFAMRWTAWMFGLSHVLRPELYEAVGYWLVRLSIAVVAVGYLGYSVSHYLF